MPRPRRPALRWLLALQLAALLGGGCGRVPEEELARSLAAITDGSAHDGHPAVGLLLVYDEQGEPVGQCSGTLVGPTTVLTAAHCLVPAGSHFFVAGDQEIKAWRAVQHPDFDPKVPVIPLDHDLGVVRLERAPAVAPARLTPWAPVSGGAVTLVGFGVTGEGLKDGGTKRIAYNAIQEVTARRFSLASSGEAVGSICHGDSGGPAFAQIAGQEVLVGVASAIEGLCGSGTAWEIRVDSYLEWLLEAAGEPLAVARDRQLAAPAPAVIAAPPSEPLPLETVAYLDVSDNGDPAAAEAGCSLAGQPAGGGVPFLALLLVKRARAFVRRRRARAPISGRGERLR